MNVLCPTNFYEWVAPPAEGYANDMIEGAIATAQANNRPLMMAPGVYAVNVTQNGKVFTIDSSLTIQALPGAQIVTYHDGDRQNADAFVYDLFAVDLTSASDVVRLVDLHITGPSINGTTRAWGNAASVAVHPNCVGDVVLERVQIDGEFKYGVQPSSSSANGTLTLRDCRLSAEAQGLISNAQAGNYRIRDQGSIWENVWLTGVLPHHVYCNGVESLELDGSTFRNCEIPIVGTGTPPFAVFRDCLFESSCGRAESMEEALTVFDNCIFQAGSGIRGESDLIVRDCTFDGAMLTVGDNSGARVWQVANCHFTSDQQLDALTIQKDDILLSVSDCYFYGIRVHIWNPCLAYFRGSIFDNRDEIVNSAILLRNEDIVLDAHDVMFLGDFDIGAVYDPESATISLVDCVGV